MKSLFWRVLMNISDREYTTYPRQFKAYRWYKPILIGLLTLSSFYCVRLPFI